MRVTFWGVRGSITTPEAEYARYGGNTPCVTARLGDGTLICFDAGMGFRWMTTDLLQQGGPAPAMALLLTHCHWDHIQGIPFSPMMYVRGYHVDIYGRGGDLSLRETILKQMDPAYCPVPNFFLHDDVGASVSINQIGDEETFEFGSARITARALPRRLSNYTTGYRLEDGPNVIAYMSDLEYPEGPARCPAAIDLARNAELVIHDAQFLPEDRPRKKGWGHSTYEDAIELARLAGARRVALFHHDPARTDDQLDALIASLDGPGPQVFAAREGLELEL